MAAKNTKTEPRYAFSFRYKENVREALNKIMARDNVTQNEAVELSLLKVAKSNIKIK